MFLLYVRYAVLVLSVPGLVLILLRPSYAGPVLSFMFVLASLLWFRRAFVEFGWGSVRGQLTGILGLSFLVQAAACMLMGSDGGVHIPNRAFVPFFVARLLFLTASARYTFHFLRKWYVLPAGKLRSALLSTLLVVLGISVIPGVLPRIVHPSGYTLFVLVDVLLLVSSFYNLFLFWGTMVMKRWVFGTAVVILLILGDALLLANSGGMAAVIVWYLAATSISLTGTVRT